MANETPFKIGNVDLSDGAAPEGLGDLGGEQRYALHEFPGGVMTAQLMGEFPKLVEFKQRLFGQGAIGKVQELDDLRRQGGVQLSWAQWSYFGLIKLVEIIAKHEWELEYKCIFQPIDIQQSRAPSTTLDNEALMAKALDLMQQQTNSPISNYSFPPQFQNDVQNLQNSANQTLQQNQGNLYNVPSGQITALKGQVTALKNQLGPLMNSGSVEAGVAAADLMNTLRAIEVSLGRGVNAQKEIVVQDPNLFSLAASYYDDPNKWQLIADANRLIDPQPRGKYRLIIPENPGLSEVKPLSLL